YKREGAFRPHICKYDRGFGRVAARRPRDPLGHEGERGSIADPPAISPNRFRRSLHGFPSLCTVIDWVKRSSEPLPRDPPQLKLSVSVAYFRIATTRNQQANLRISAFLVKLPGYGIAEESHRPSPDTHALLGVICGNRSVPSRNRSQQIGSSSRSPRLIET